MTIHHDKMAYGKLEILSEKFSDEKLAKMAKLLSENNGGAQEKEEKGAAENKKDGSSR